MIDKQIHKDEFRLRVLLTNGCNKNCGFCLNDFQSKEPVQHADFMDLQDCLRAYGQFMKSIGEKSIVTFSGGEPGTYPLLGPAVRTAYHFCDTVKVVTNGLAYKEHLLPYVHKWHLHVMGKYDLDRYLGHNDRIVIQIVVTDDMDEMELFYLVDYYHISGFLIKLFVDFKSNNKQKIEEKILRIYEAFNRERVCTRFTGVQVNRGPACYGCQQECITLKALWYFPDGSSSTCPQGLRKKYNHDSWDETMDVAYAAHKVKGS